MYPPPWGIRFGIGGRGMVGVHHRTKVHIPIVGRRMCRAGQMVRLLGIGMHASQYSERRGVYRWGWEDGTRPCLYLVCLLSITCGSGLLAVAWLFNRHRLRAVFAVDAQQSGPNLRHQGLHWRWRHRFYFRAFIPGLVGTSGSRSWSFCISTFFYLSVGHFRPSVCLGHIRYVYAARLKLGLRLWTWI
jgi:hypothetical protein